MRPAGRRIGGLLAGALVLGRPASGCRIALSLSLSADAQEGIEHTMDDARPKVLIFIVAYAAAQHIESLLERLNASLPQLISFDLHVLMIDDASPDNTAALADKFQARSGIPLTILRNPVNQGYGGNQKVGYQYTLRFGFDAVVLLHGDGQYPPELISTALKTLFAEQAEVVLGSRMLERKNALKGGMPTYKYVGNIILTRLQNKILGMRLSEFHTGFRVYRTSLLARLPFSYNSNDFDFDTDILIQSQLARARIVEIAIPTHYGDETSHVNGVKYAWQILRSSVLAKVQALHVYYHPKFDLAPDVGYESKVGFDSTHDFAIRHVELYETVLDIGGSSGYVATVLRQKKGCYVYGVDSCVHPATLESYDHFRQIDLDHEDIAAVFPHERPVQTVLLLDVVEHLSAAEQFMIALREQTAASRSKIIITTANVGFIFTRLSLLIGNFNYGKRGILDFTHLRLFTFGSLKRLLQYYGYSIEVMQGIPLPFQLALGKHRRLAKMLTLLNRLAMGISKKLFSYQIAAVVRPLPTLDLLLRRAEETQPWLHRVKPGSDPQTQQNPPQ